jgi:putative FmdB family regulatory protein
MPIYEYACQKCGNVVEVFQKVNEKGPAKCPKCGGKLARVLSHTSFQLKGGGWYKDLYSSVKPGSSDSVEGPKDAPSEKSEAKSDATKTDAPKVDAPKTEAPKSEAKSAEAKPTPKPTAKPAKKKGKR